MVYQIPFLQYTRLMSCVNLSKVKNYILYTECPTDMGTTSNSFLQFLKPYTYLGISKSKTCFENLMQKSFRWYLDIEQN